MKIKTILFTLIVLSIWLTPWTRAENNSQKEPGQLAPPLQHERKVYVDLENKFIYWPMSKPFWVRLAESPKQDAPSYLLHKFQVGSSNSDIKDLVGGITLEIQGRQFIRWYDVKTDQTTFLKFYADGVPPTVKESLDHAPIYQSKDTLFYGKNLTLSIASKDEISGVAAVYYAIDNAAFIPYDKTFPIDKEKPYHIRIYAVDRVGYAGKPKSLHFFVDLTSPTTTHTIHTNFLGDILSPDTTIQLTSGDTHSGVNRIFYGIDDPGEGNQYKDKHIPLDTLKDGLHTLYYSADDKVLNRETRQEYTFYFDNTPPQVSSQFQGDHHHADSTDFVSPRTRILLTATDNKVGMGRIQYDIGTRKDVLYREPFLVRLQSGTHTISYRGADKLDNISKKIDLPVFMDDTAPTSSHKIVGAQYRQRNDTWMTKDTVIHLDASDKDSGVQHIFFQIGDKPGYQTYKQPFKVEQEGRYLFRYHGLDNVNNRESDHSSILLVDNTPPKIIVTFSLESKQTRDGENGEKINVYPRNTSLFLGATDNSAGIEAIWYTIGENKEILYSKALPFTKPGTYHVAMRAKDNVGNQSTNSTTFIIE
jgi:hypothetical protein